MPRQAPSASEFTTVVKSSAVANNIASLPAGSMAAARAVSSASSSSRGALSAVGAIIRQSTAGKAKAPVQSSAVVAVNTGVVRPNPLLPDPRLKRTEFASITMPTPIVNRDVLVAKYYKTGELQWMITGKGNDIADVTGMANDMDGNLFVIGSFTSNILTIRDSGGNVKTLTRATATQHSFVMMFNTLGLLQWAAKIENVFPSNVAIDSNGNVYALVYAVSSTAIAYSGNESPSLPLGEGGNIVYYGVDGSVKWAWSVLTASGGYFLTVDKNDDLLFTAITIGNGEGVARNRGLSTGITLTDTRIFTTKLRPSTGQAIWMTGINIAGSSGNNTQLNAIHSDINGNVFVGFNSRFANNIRAVGSSTVNSLSTTAPPAQLYDAFVVKYNSSGSAQWVVRIKESLATTSGNDTLESNSVSTDSQGNVYVAGSFVSGVLGFVNADGNESPITMTRMGGGDMFLVKFDSAGILQWGAHIASILSDGYVNVQVDKSSDEVYFSGYCDRPVSVRISTPANVTGVTTNLPFSGNHFVVKFNSEGGILWRTKVDHYNGKQSIAADPYGNLFYASLCSEGIPVVAYTKVP